MTFLSHVQVPLCKDVCPVLPVVLESVVLPNALDCAIFVQ